MMKKLGKAILIGCMMVMPMQVFGQTDNHIPYISKVGIDQVTLAQVMIDNKAYDLKPGQYFTIRLENAEFDFEDGEARVRSNTLDIGGSSKQSIYATLKDSVTEGGMVSFSFHSKILGGDAKVIIEPEDSGISGGTYVYATTDKLPLSYKAEIVPVTPVFFDQELVVPTLVINEQLEAAFRTIQMYNTSNEPLLTIMPESKDLKIRSSHAYEEIVFVVEDGNGNSRRYVAGKDPEVSFDYTTNKLTFKKADNDIFDTEGKKYTIRIENMKVLPEDKDVELKEIKLVVDGLLVNKKTLTLGDSSLEPLKLEASKEEMQLGRKQTIKFSLTEQQSGLLFKEGRLLFGVYGEVKIASPRDLKFTLKDGINTYTEAEKNAFTLVFDSLGDRVTIEGYRRKSNKDPIKLEGELTVTVPDSVTRDVEFFVSEPSVAEVVKQTVLTTSEDILQPPLPTTPADSVVKFTVGEKSYRLDGEIKPIDSSPYISAHNRIMVPVRYVAYALGVDEDNLVWDGPTNTVRIGGDKPMSINMETGRLVVGENSFILSEVKLFGGRTYVPVGEIARAFGKTVDWDGETRTATFK